VPKTPTPVRIFDTMSRKFILFAAASSAIAVTLGALGAHYLKGKAEAGVLTPDNLISFETAVRYQLYHSLALILLFVLSQYKNSSLLKYSGYLFIAGIFLFSGSIYFLSTKALTGLSNLQWLGPITPLGGLCFIAGWICLLVNFIKKEKQ
jgi:uncharacterized membrane protein YgdD (TMEM256/DUF423 family)